MSNTATVASPESIKLLELLWGERTDKEFPREKFETYPQIRVSALIDEVKVRPALPPTEAQMDEIGELCDALGFDKSKPVEDRTHANRKLYRLRRAKRHQDYEARKAAASSELDELFSGTNSEDAPF